LYDDIFEEKWGQLQRKLTLFDADLDRRGDQAAYADSRHSRVSCTDKLRHGPTLALGDRPRGLGNRLVYQGEIFVGHAIGRQYVDGIPEWS
jgi:hypothetical protein